MQKVVIVNGTTELLDLVQPVLTAGRDDVVFVESNAHAYSHIKREKPSLVILCLDMHERDGFQVLSMLKLDEETRGIPVLTYTTEFDGPESEEEVADTTETEIFTPKPAVWMN
jgi:CheY-like chemotaxis protein